MHEIPDSDKPCGLTERSLEALRRNYWRLAETKHCSCLCVQSTVSIRLAAGTFLKVPGTQSHVLLNWLQERTSSARYIRVDSQIKSRLLTEMSK